jgi:Flp pilus assembly protein TadG
MPGRADRGAVTVEAALAMCSLVVVVAAAIGSVAAVASSIRCIDAAREMVRLTARGEPDRGRDVATALAPAGARMELTVRGDEITAEVTTAPVPLLPWRVGGLAVGVLEPGVAP